MDDAIFQLRKACDSLTVSSREKRRKFFKLKFLLRFTTELLDQILLGEHLNSFEPQQLRPGEVIASDVNWYMEVPGFSAKYHKIMKIHSYLADFTTKTVLY